jgi:hypothetical protein
MIISNLMVKKGNKKRREEEETRGLGEEKTRRGYLLLIPNS